MFDPVDQGILICGRGLHLILTGMDCKHLRLTYHKNLHSQQYLGHTRIATMANKHHSAALHSSRDAMFCALKNMSKEVGVL